MQLVDHETDDFFVVLGDHADAVALAQAAEEVFLGPGVVEALLLGRQDFGHVAADHPADVDANLVLQVSSGIHGSRPPLRGPRSRWAGARAAPFPFRLRSTPDRRSLSHD